MSTVINSFEIEATVSGSQDYGIVAVISQLRLKLAALFRTGFQNLLSFSNRNQSP